MLFQIAGTAERLCTLFASIRFLTRMGPHVKGQVGGLREGQATTRMPTLKGFLTRMVPHVRGQVGGLRERHPTTLEFTLP